MANEEHKRLILQGVSQWNMWRQANHSLNLLPDLSDVDFMDKSFVGANFTSTNLSGVNFAFADLSGTNFFGSNLINATLQRGNLSDANLSQANLTNANLTEALLIGTLLNKTDFKNALFASTVLANLDLRECKNLDTIRHKNSSSLAVDTIMRSRGTLQAGFLRGVGLSESFITFLSVLEYPPNQIIGTGEKYYTYEISHDKTYPNIYTILDTAKPFGENLSRTTETPQGDGKTSGPHYLEPVDFWDKVSDMYKDSR